MCGSPYVMERNPQIERGVSHYRENPMIHTRHVAFAALFLCSSGTASADVRAYTCEVIHVYDLTDTGSLEKVTALEKSMKGSSFSVSRETGAITGKFLTLDTSLAKSTHVINKGSKENTLRHVCRLHPLVP